MHGGRLRMRSPQRQAGPRERASRTPSLAAICETQNVPLVFQLRELILSPLLMHVLKLGFCHLQTKDF